MTNKFVNNKQRRSDLLLEVLGSLEHQNQWYYRGLGYRTDFTRSVNHLYRILLSPSTSYLKSHFLLTLVSRMNLQYQYWKHSRKVRLTQTRPCNVLKISHSLPFSGYFREFQDSRFKKNRRHKSKIPMALRCLGILLRTVVTSLVSLFLWFDFPKVLVVGCAVIRNQLNFGYLVTWKCSVIGTRGVDSVSLNYCLVQDAVFRYDDCNERVYPLL